jgi:SAM-dependent methyltransferase
MPTPAHDPPLHGLDPTRRFSDRAEDYVKYRPGYPAAAFAAMLEGLDPARLTAADVGAGTGISARLLAARGVRVIAVEPNRAMREAAAPDPRITWRKGTGEATGLPDASVGLVLCAQSFHWMRTSEAIAEFHRILSPGGRLAVMWNNRDRRDPMTMGFIEAIHAVHGEHPVERAPFEPEVMSAGGLFTPPRQVAVPNHQVLEGREGLLGRATSASYVPKDGERLARLTALLDDLYDRHRDAHGRVRMHYVTHVYLARRL